MNELMITKLKSLATREGIDSNNFDFKAEWDDKLNITENFDILKAKFNLKSIKEKVIIEKVDEGLGEQLEQFNELQQFKQNGTTLPNLDEVKTLGIIGDRGYGKSSIMWTLTNEYKGKRTIVFYSYPTPIKYKQIHTLHELELLTDCIVFMDELQKHIKFYNKATSDEFMDILSTMSHNNNTLVFTTPMSQFITKSLDCFMDGFIYVRISDMGALKNGSKAKRLLQEFSSERISKRTVRLTCGEYLQIIDGQEESNGLHIFSNPSIKKAWRNCQKDADILPK